MDYSMRFLKLFNTELDFNSITIKAYTNVAEQRVCDCHKHFVFLMHHNNMWK